MIEKTYQTPSGTIHYFVNILDEERPTLVFLPGLTADHRLFDKQIEHFEGRENVFVWDAPGHYLSRPFTLNFTLMDKAAWLKAILEEEGIKKPVIVGQSMGGYVGQAFAQQYPELLKGFISIDSAPLQRSYVTGIEIWLLKHTEWMYRIYPWKSLLKAGSNGVATTAYGRALMHDMMMTYDGRQAEYAALSGHGFRILAEAMEADLPYEVRCPMLLICGDKDHAGSAKNYNKRWHEKGGIPIAWIRNAGHNANTDKPEKVNYLIEKMLGKVLRHV